MSRAAHTSVCACSHSRGQECTESRAMPQTFCYIYNSKLNRAKGIIYHFRMQAHPCNNFDPRLTGTPIRNPQPPFSARDHCQEAVWPRLQNSATQTPALVLLCALVKTEKEATSSVVPHQTFT